MAGLLDTTPHSRKNNLDIAPQPTLETFPPNQGPNVHAPSRPTPAQRLPLLEVILALLASVFLPAAGNDEARAYQAARQALASLGPLSFPELLAHAHAIALTVGSLASLAEANEPDLPQSLVIRFRANGHALAKSAERIRRTQSGKGKYSSPTPKAAPDPRPTAPATAAAWSDAFASVAQEFAPAHLAAHTQKQDAIIRAALASAAQALSGRPQQPTA